MFAVNDLENKNASIHLFSVNAYKKVLNSFYLRSQEIT